jgi:hypothetical protein
MNFQSELIADFRAMLAECGVDVVIGNDTLRGMVSEPELSQQIDLGGLVPESDMSVKLVKSNLPSTPVLGQIVQVDGEHYRITSIRRRPSSPFITLEIASPHE